MNAMLLLDVQGACRTFGTVQAFAGAAAALEASPRTNVDLVTDWGTGAVYGVAQVAGSAATAPALLEKLLRDRGETDDICRILVHESRTRAGMTEMAFTAVPMKTWLASRQVAADHPNTVMLHDWHRLLIDWGRQQGLHQGAVVVLRTSGLDLVQFDQGRVRAIERLGVFDGEAGGWERLGSRVAAALREQAAASGDPEPPAVTAWVLQGAAPHVEPFLNGAGGITVRDCRIEAGESPAAIGLSTAPLQAASLRDALPVARSVGRTAEKAAFVAERWLPAVSMAALALSVAIGATAAVLHVRTGEATSTTAATAAQPLAQQLQAALQDLEATRARQQGMGEWYRQRAQGGRVPDMLPLLAQVRGAAPAGMVIDEVGLVVEKGGHLVTIVGHSGVVGDSLRSEQAFVQAMLAHGFVVHKRDLQLQGGRPQFRLSMTRETP